MPVSNEGAFPPSIACSVRGNNMTLAWVEPTAKQTVRRLDATNSALSGGRRTRPADELAIGLMSDPGLRGMIEVWFELDKMKSNLIPGPRFAWMLKRCNERIRCAIMHLASEPAADRSGGSEAVAALWMEAVARGKAETAAALAELTRNMTLHQLRQKSSNQFGAKAVAMAQPALDSPGIVALVCERVAAGVTEDVRRRLELESGAGGPQRSRAGPILPRPM